MKKKWRDEPTKACTGYVCTQSPCCCPTVTKTGIYQQLYRIPNPSIRNFMKIRSALAYNFSQKRATNTDIWNDEVRESSAYLMHLRDNSCLTGKLQKLYTKRDVLRPKQSCKFLTLSFRKLNTTERKCQYYDDVFVFPKLIIGTQTYWSSEYRRLPLRYYKTATRSSHGDLVDARSNACRSLFIHRVSQEPHGTRCWARCLQ
jgi:hypothetical protein